MSSPGGNDDFGIPIHSFEKNKKEQIRISLNEFKGHQYIDIRTFYLDGADFKPSSKGVTLKKELYPELLKGVLDLAQVLGIDPEALEAVQEQES